MKHNYHILMAIAFVLSLAFAGCKKDTPGNVSPTITDDKVEVTATSATFTWTVEWVGKRISVVEISENVDMNDSRFYGSEEELNTNSFSTTANDLKPATKYYYRFWVWNQNYADNRFVFEKKSLSTHSDLPKVTTSPVSNMTWTTAVGGGNVTDDCGSEVTERGICWSESPKPTISDQHLASGSGTGNFTVQMENLEPNKTYYVRAYAKNSEGIGYGEDESFITNETLLPEVITTEVTDIAWWTAVGGGKVTNENGAAVTERGICWSTGHNPELENCMDNANSGSGLGSFSVNMTGLTAGTTYYVRAYAKNIVGLKYGDEVTFKTNDPLPPTVTTVGINSSSISWTEAEVNCRITVTNGTSIFEKGVCWSMSNNPNYEEHHIASSSNTSDFTVQLSGLDPGTTYYVRAYARSNVEDLTYGEILSFKTKDIEAPSVTTSDIVQITQQTAKGGGNVTSDGGSPVTQRGICWGTSHNPTLYNNSGNTTNGMGVGSYTSNMTSLTPYTKYYVRAYAINSVDTIYGNERSFITHAITPTGAIDGMFSVSATKQVWFSQGNLQYQASSNTWRFAADQDEYIGSNNGHISETYSGWIDLFGWGTSGRDHGAVCYQPWSTSTNYADYYAYGSYMYNLYDNSGEADWGYNAISNGGNQENLWRTLTFEEWDYLLNRRYTPSGIRFVYSKDGLVILPDDWNSNTYQFEYINGYPSTQTNNISNSDWENLLEPAGAVLLPLAGYRSENQYTRKTYFDFGNLGGNFTMYYSKYYSSTSHGDKVGCVNYNRKVYDSGGSLGEIECSNESNRTRGCSVRLVQDIN